MFSKVQLIYADLPYHFNSKHFQDGGRKFKEISYVTMKQKDMEAIKIKKIIADDSVCFIWTPESRVKDAMNVMEAWGFRFIKIAFYWEKTTVLGNTYYNFSPTTLCSMECIIYGTRGKVSKYKQCNNVKDKLDDVRTIHSRKPKEARDRIDKLFGKLNKVELFATEDIDGWKSWGYDIDGKSVENHIDELLKNDINVENTVKPVIKNKVCSNCGYSTDKNDEFELHLTRPFHLNSLPITVTTKGNRE
jgi:N6-adenosine-specific RNA methylase IME4